MASRAHPYATRSFLPRREPPRGTRRIDNPPAEVWVVLLHRLLHRLTASRASKLKTVSDVRHINMDMSDAAAVFELANHKDGVIDKDFGMCNRAVLRSVDKIRLGIERRLDEIEGRSSVINDEIRGPWGLNMVSSLCFG